MFKYVRGLYNSYLCSVFLCLFLLVGITKAEEQSDFDCLVEAVYWEARNQDLTSQLAVANVIINRVMLDNFPNTICGVVHEGQMWEGHMVRDACEFSYYCDGKSESMRESNAILQALEVADMAMNGSIVAEIERATHYHASYVYPYWADDMIFLAQIGHHKFYME